MKIRAAGAELSVWAEGGMDGETDRKTDMTKLTVAFSNFAKASNKEF